MVCLLYLSIKIPTRLGKNSYKSAVALEFRKDLNSGLTYKLFVRLNFHIEIKKKYIIVWFLFSLDLLGGDLIV